MPPGARCPSLAKSMFPPIGAAVPGYDALHCPPVTQTSKGVCDRRSRPPSNLDCPSTSRVQDQRQNDSDHFARQRPHRRRTQMRHGCRHHSKAANSNQGIPYAPTHDAFRANRNRAPISRHPRRKQGRISTGNSWPLF